MIQFTVSSLTGAVPAEPDMYSKLYDGGNQSGRHCFDGIVLNGFTDLYDLVVDSLTPDGEIVSWKDKASAEVRATFMIHRNGRQGERDLDLDTVVMTVDTMRQLPEEAQTLLYGYEKVPGGRRS